MAYIWECDICHSRVEKNRKYWVMGEKIYDPGITDASSHIEVCSDCAAFLQVEIQEVKRRIAERREKAHGNA